MKNILLSSILVSLVSSPLLALDIGEVEFEGTGPGIANVFLVETVAPEDGNPRITQTGRTISTTGWLECAIVPGSFQVNLPPAKLTTVSGEYLSSPGAEGTTTVLTDKSAIEMAGGTFSYILLHSGYNVIETHYNILSKIEVNAYAKVKPKLADSSLYNITGFDTSASPTDFASLKSITKAYVPSVLASEQHFTIDLLGIYAKNNKKLDDVVDLSTLGNDVRINIQATCNKV